MHEHENKEALQQKADQQAQEKFRSDDFFDHFITFTLNNFSYRYFETSPIPEAQKVDALTYDVRQTDVPILTGLTSKNKKLKMGAKDLAKRYPGRQGATLAYVIRVELEHKEPTRPGKALLTTAMSWDHPRHELVENCLKNEFSFEYDEALELRNNLAFHLESLCELF